MVLHHPSARLSLTLKLTVLVKLYSAADRGLISVQEGTE